MSANASDVLKVLVCGDVHLGFKEDDAIRGMDSFTTFDEVCIPCGAACTGVLLLITLPLGTGVHDSDGA